MKVLGRVLAVLASLVLAAHFLRAGMMLRYTGSVLAPLAFLGVLAALALPFLLLVRAPWGVALLRIALALGTLEWVRYLAEMAARRRAEGVPWVRAVAILSSVAVVTALAAVLLRPREVTGTGSGRS